VARLNAGFWCWAASETSTGELYYSVLQYPSRLLFCCATVRESLGKPSHDSHHCRGAGVLPVRRRTVRHCGHCCPFPPGAEQVNITERASKPEIISAALELTDHQAATIARLEQQQRILFASLAALAAAWLLF
jgi:hypothetical protein